MQIFIHYYICENFYFNLILICRERDIEINLRFLQFPIMIKLALCFAPPTPIDYTNDAQYIRKYKKVFLSL